jgi:D-arabinose 1-dehydrogenase-like Zn-dependent alcohol dehydrogenase
VAIPETLSDVDAAPLLCAGITPCNALRHSGALPGDLVAVEGVGGLGHLGIQFANEFGYQVAAIGRGSETAPLAKARHSIPLRSRRYSSFREAEPFKAGPLERPPILTTHCTSPN